MRLSIKILLCYTAVVAVTLRLHLYHVAYLREVCPKLMQEEMSKRVAIVDFVMQSLLASVALVGAVMVVRLIRRGVPLEPGHWILLISGVLAFVSLSSNTVIAWLVPATPQAFQLAALVQTTIELTMVLVGYAVASVCSRSGWLWRTFFVYVCASAAIAGAANIATDLGGLQFETFRAWTIALGVAFLALLIAAAIAEMRKAKRRNLLHWVGVAQLFAVSALSLLMALP